MYLIGGKFDGGWTSINPHSDTLRLATDDCPEVTPWDGAEAVPSRDVQIEIYRCKTFIDRHEQPADFWVHSSVTDEAALFDVTRKYSDLLGRWTF